MEIVFVASEVAPWSKTGGLGDVAGALPRALAARGHAVSVYSPRYYTIDVRSPGFESGGQIGAFRIETGQLGELRLGIAAELDAVQRLAPGGLGGLAEPGHDRYRRGPRRGVSARREGKQLPRGLLLAARLRP